MRSDSAMQPDLNDAVLRFGGLQHGLAFPDGVAGGFFDEQMRAGFQGGDGRQGVPMIGSGHDHDIRTRFTQHRFVVFEQFGLIAGKSFHLVGRSR